MSRESIAIYCAEEVSRMALAHERFAPMLEEMAFAAHAPLLRTTLLEHRDANNRMYHDAMVVVGILDGAAKPEVSAEVDAVMAMARRGLAVEDDIAVRDLQLAQGAIHAESYILVTYAGLSTWLRQLGHDEAADRVDETLSLLGAGERHLETMRSALSRLFPDDQPSDPIELSKRRRASTNISAFEMKD